MRQALITLLTLTIVWSTASVVMAQVAKGPEQKSTTPATNSDTDQPGEVELALAEAKKRGEPVLNAGGDSSGEKGHGLPNHNGQAIRLPKPAYSSLARAAHVGGAVEVRVLIDFDGKVVAAQAVSGHPLLYAASVKAARGSEFKPMKLDGQPVKVTGVIRYNFVAQ
jgi:TonB family protein